MKIKIYSILLLLANYAFGGEVYTFKHPGPIEGIVLEIYDGNVHMTGNLTKASDIEYEIFQEGCMPEIFVKESKLHIQSRNSGCKTHYNINSPQDVKTIIMVGAGDVNVNNISAPVTITLGKGNIRLQDLIKDISAKLGMGNIEFITDIKPSKPIKLEFEIGTGNVTCNIPTKSIIKKKFTGNIIPNIDNSISANNKKYHFDLNFKIGFGNLSINSLKPSNN